MSLKEKVHGLEFSQLSVIKTEMRHVEDALGKEDDMEAAQGAFAKLKGAAEALVEKIEDLSNGK